MTENTAVKIAVLVSGGGTNLQALLDAGLPVALVISDRDGVHALERARNAGVPAQVVLPDAALKGDARRLEHSGRICAACREAGAGLIVLAGYLSILRGDILHEYAGRIINLHPALLPKYGGKGMWGHHVHEAVLAAGEPESGCTVHIVTEGVDAGPILIQKRVPVQPNDTPATLATRIAPAEHEAIVDATKLMMERLQ
jgi:phosphoribosylglycinamide formyltransferase-1